MSLQVHVPLNLRQLTGNRDTVKVEGRTIRECMDDLIRQFPDSKPWLDVSNPAAWIALNLKIVGITELDQKVSESDELSLILILDGG